MGPDDSILRPDSCSALESRMTTGGSLSRRAQTSNFCQSSGKITDFLWHKEMLNYMHPFLFILNEFVDSDWGFSKSIT